MEEAKKEKAKKKVDDRKIIFTNGFMVDSITVGVFQELFNHDIPPALAFQVTNILEEIQEKMKAYSEVQKKLLKKFATLDESGEPVAEDGVYQFDDDNQEKFVEEMQKLRNLKVEMKLEKISFFMNDITESISPSKLSLLKLVANLK